MSTILVFGYGSLLDTASLHATAPGAKNVRPAFIIGFHRDFSFHDPVGWKSTNLDVSGEPFCAVNILPTNKQCRVNGIVFTVSPADLKQLTAREEGYKIIKTTVYDYKNGATIGVCYVFSANESNGTYNFNSAAQKRYLDVCLAGAQSYGNEFYKEFLETTRIEKIPLAELPLGKHESN